MIDESKVKGHLAMLGANVMWGLMSPVVKIVFAAGGKTLEEKILRMIRNEDTTNESV